MEASATTLTLRAPRILSLIFSFVASSPRDVFTVSQVVSVWRTVAIHEPQLWTAITTELSIDGILCFLSRSQNSPLDVHFALSVVVDGPHERIRAFMDPVVSHAWRWRSFAVDVPLAEWMDTVLNMCRERLAGHVLELDALSLRVNSNTQYGYTSNDGMRLPTLLFSPRHLVLDCVPAWQPTPFSPRLRSLDIRNHRRLISTGPSHNEKVTLAPDMSIFLALMERSPALESIQILSSAPTLSAEALPRVFLPSLHTVSIEATDALALATFLEYATAPALTTLYIKWSGNVQVDSVEPFIASLPMAVPQLESLSISTVAHIPTAAWITLLSGLKALRHVAFEAVDFSREIFLVLSGMPALRSLMFHHQDQITCHDLAALLRARISREDVPALQMLEISWCDNVDPTNVQVLTELVPHLIVRFGPEAVEQSIEETMEEMDLDDDNSDDEEGSDDGDESDMDDDDDEQNWESDVRAELELLREDHKNHRDMIRAWA